MRYIVSIMMLALAVTALAAMAADNDVRYENYRVSGPYTHKNLDVFFIHGSDLVADENLMTLNEALKEDKVVVHETGDVQELAIENKSGRWIFIHAGDIVKGGRQDRVIHVDILVKPYSKSTHLPSFCVEQGRWSQRGHENPHAFESSNNIVSSKELKIAAKLEKSQNKVWSEVDNLQNILESSTGVCVRGGRSASSLQLTLENSEVNKESADYLKAIKDAMYGDDIIGFAFAINGEINSADIYRSHELFMKMWPKLAEACVVEAIAGLSQSDGFDLVTADQIATWLEFAEQEKASQEMINEYTRLKVREGANDVLFETFDAESEGMIHKNVIKR